MSKTRTWQDNAAVCALMDEGEGWAFARHIACSAVRMKPGGKAPASNSDRNYQALGKTSVTEFARAWRTGPARALRYLEAWNKAAEQGLCTPSADLTPADAPTTAEPDVPWGSIYDASKSGGRSRDGKTKGASTTNSVITALDDDEFVARVVEEMTPEQRNHVRREVNVQEIKRIDEKRKDEKRVEKGIEEQLVEEMSEVTKNIYVPLSNVRRTLAQVNGTWNKFDGAIDLERVGRKVSGIQAELGVLEMYVTGVPFPAENGMPE